MKDEITTQWRVTELKGKLKESQGSCSYGKCCGCGHGKARVAARGRHHSPGKRSLAHQDNLLVGALTDKAMLLLKVSTCVCFMLA